MKENPYDNPIFFQKYSQMLRSTQGLEGAGEWRELQKLLPDFAGKRVLDLGCGYGWHCGYAAGHGAAYVLGTDLSERDAGDGPDQKQRPGHPVPPLRHGGPDLPGGQL